MSDAWAHELAERLPLEPRSMTRVILYALNDAGYQIVPKVELEGLLKQHGPATIMLTEPDCWHQKCEHDECPETPVEVCGWCWELWTQEGRDDEAPVEDVVRYPCPVTAALQALDKENG